MLREITAGLASSFATFTSGIFALAISEVAGLLMFALAPFVGIGVVFGLLYLGD